MFNPKHLPDITTHYRADNPLPLQWVGMEDIAIPFWVAFSDATPLHITGKADLFVSLNNDAAKGIHMSRLHLKLNQLAGKKLDKTRINTLLENMIHSQEGISQSAKVTLRFELVLKKPSLSSNETGYQSYPVTFSAERINNNNCYQLELTIPYSSTCPCSASLSRQLYSEAIDKQFSTLNIDKQALLKWIQSEAGSVATPHGQRSYAYIKLDFGDNPWPEFPALIFQLEEIIGTPVQTAVKRKDEQEFARLNAENLMFCEDAARRIKNSLERMSFVTDYWFKVEHQESLHAHNAVVIDQKFPDFSTTRR
jgi:GTP cyclohydrolase I